MSDGGEEKVRHVRCTIILPSVSKSFLSYRTKRAKDYGLLRAERLSASLEKYALYVRGIYIFIYIREGAGTRQAAKGV